MKINKVHRASCHCQAVIFELHLPNGLIDPKRCNCSLCSRRGAIMGMIAQENLKIIQGEDKLTLYQFHTMTAKHYFCSICGIYTHHQRRSDPTQFAFNVACLEGVDSFELKDVPVSNGKNHSADGI
jgi:hypothetical protein